MRANFKTVWVRKLIGKLGVPYNRRLRVRGSPHPLFYDADLSLPAADSNAFRIHVDLLSLACRIAPLSCFASMGLNRAAKKIPLAFWMPIFGLPAVFFIIIVSQISCVKCISV
jgi:hypothetical protein